MNLNKLIILILILALKQNCFLQTINYNLLELKDSLMYLNNVIYSGIVVDYNVDGQVKSIYEVKNGRINGEYSKFYLQKNFNKSEYLDTTIVNNLMENVKQKEIKLAKLISDTVELSLKKNNIFQNEIGSEKKLLKLHERYYLDKLNEKNKKIYTEFTNKTTELKNKQLEINSIINQIKSEKTKLDDESSKKTFIPTKEFFCRMKNGVKNGDYIKYNEDYIKIEEGTFLNGKQEGMWYYYFKEGNLDSKGKYIQGDGSNLGNTGIPRNGRNGLWISYHKNGNLAQEAIYKNGLIEGSFKSYYENGKLQEESTMINDLENGISKYYYENGNLQEETNYFEGEKDGKGKIYYDDGSIKTEYTAKKGLLEGKCKHYYETGKIKTEYTYVNNNPHGPILVYDNSGNLQYKSSIDSTSKFKGKLFGDTYIYNSDGTINKSFYANLDGSVIDKTKKNTTIASNGNLNKSYNCKCCKNIIKGIKNGVDEYGNEFNTYSLELAKAFYKILNYENEYEYLRKETYKFCTLKCSRMCN